MHSSRILRPLRFVTLSAAGFALAATAHAQQIFMTATMDGGQETPPVATTATGFGSFVLDTAANTLTFHIEFSGLTSSENNAHIHGFAPPGTPAGVLYPLALGSPKTGTIQYPEADEQGILAGQTYVNIHSVNFPSGEIRGQILQVVPPTIVCEGDGTLAPCPCGNDTVTGAGGCLNSTGTGGILAASGFASLSQESVTMTASALPTGTVIFFQGTTLQAPVFQGDGLRCTGGTLVRLKTTPVTAGSPVTYPSGNDAPISGGGGIGQPVTRVYQAWYSDPNAAFCTPAAYNVTNAVEVLWLP